MEMSSIRCSPENPRRHTKKGGGAQEEDVPDAEEAQGSCLGAGCSNRYSHTKVLPASFPGALGSGNIHATHCTCTSPGFTAQQGVLPSLKSLHYHLKFSPPVINISCTGTKSFSDLFSILSLLTHHLQFSFSFGSKLTPKFSLLYLFISLPGPFPCLPPISLLPCPKSHPAFCAGRLVLGSAGTGLAEHVLSSLSGQCPVCQEPNCSPGKSQGERSN